METLPEQIDDLKQQIRTLGALVEQAISQVVVALVRYDTMLAKAVIVADQKIDLHELQVEERCLRILADHRPQDDDLRFVVAVLKINNDLERVGDLAVNVARTVVQLVDTERFQRVGGCDTMARRAQNMVHNSLQSLLNHDARQARNVIAADDEIDEMQRTIHRRIESAIDRRPDDVTTLMQLDFIVRQLERVGDMATNIAEDVVYLVEGKIVRHESLRKRLNRPLPGRFL